MTMHYLNLIPVYVKGKFVKYTPSYGKLGSGCAIGACCGSDFFPDGGKNKLHRGIVVWPSGVDVTFRAKKGVQPPVEVVTKNGTFNVSIRNK